MRICDAGREHVCVVALQDVVRAETPLDVWKERAFAFPPASLSSGVLSTLVVTDASPW